MKITDSSRRDFLKKVGSTALGAGALYAGFNPAHAQHAADEALFKISLAEWSLNPLIFSGKLDHLDFARAAKQHGIHAVEYVNQFFMDRAEDEAYIREMRSRADGEGVRSVFDDGQPVWDTEFVHLLTQGLSTSAGVILFARDQPHRRVGFVQMKKR